MVVNEEAVAAIGRIDGAFSGPAHTLAETLGKMPFDWWVSIGVKELTTPHEVVEFYKSRARTEASRAR